MKKPVQQHDYPNTLWRRLARLGLRLYQDCFTDHAFLAAVRGVAMDQHGPVPWMNDAVLLWLKSRDWSDCHVIEVGGGASTVWWSRHAERVITIEASQEWAERTCDMVHHQGNERAFQMFHCPSHRSTNHVLVENAQRLIAAGNNVVFCIDAGFRAKLIEEVLFQQFENDPPFMVILDNSDWNPAARELLCKEMHTFDLIGRSPLVPYNTQTTIAWKTSTSPEAMAPMLPVRDRATHQLDKYHEGYLEDWPRLR